MFSTISSLAPHAISHIMKVYRTFLGGIWVYNLIRIQNCIRFAIETGFTSATFNAHQDSPGGAYLIK